MNSLDEVLTESINIFQNDEDHIIVHKLNCSEKEIFNKMEKNRSETKELLKLLTRNINHKKNEIVELQQGFSKLKYTQKIQEKENLSQNVEEMRKKNK